MPNLTRNSCGKNSGTVFFSEPEVLELLEFGPGISVEKTPQERCTAIFHEFRGKTTILKFPHHFAPENLWKKLKLA